MDLAMTECLRRGGPRRTQLLLTMQTLITALLALLYLGEVLTPAILVGASFMLGGILPGVMQRSGRSPAGSADCSDTATLRPAARRRAMAASAVPAGMPEAFFWRRRVELGWEIPLRVEARRQAEAALRHRPGGWSAARLRRGLGKLDRSGERRHHAELRHCHHGRERDDGADPRPHACRAGAGGLAGMARGGGRRSLLRSAADTVLKTWPVSTDVNSVRHNGVELLRPMREESDVGGPNPA